MALVNNRLREKLDDLGIKQADLARESGISYATINAVCMKKRNPSKAYKRQIINALITLSGQTIDPLEVFNSI